MRSEGKKKKKCREREIYMSLPPGCQQKIRCKHCCCFSLSLQCFPAYIYLYIQVIQHAAAVHGLSLYILFPTSFFILYYIKRKTTSPEGATKVFSVPLVAPFVIWSFLLFSVLMSFLPPSLSLFSSRRRLFIFFYFSSSSLFSRNKHRKIK